MGALLPLLAISEQFQADLVIAATVLFLIFATCGLIASSSAEARIQATTASKPEFPGPPATWRSPLRAAIIAGLLCGLVVLALAGF